MASLRTLDLSSFMLPNTGYMSYFLASCTTLQQVDFRNASFTSVGLSNNFFDLVPASVTVIVKDADAQTWIQAKLGAGKGTVTIYQEPTTNETT